MAKKRKRKKKVVRHRAAARKSRRPARRARAQAKKRAGARTRKKMVVRKPPRVLDPLVAQAMKVYAEGTKQFNRQNYKKAKALFEKVLSGPSREMAERARVHLAICEQRLQRPAPVRLRSADDHYHYAISQINVANYEEARAHLQKARRQAPKADYIHYALASVAALTGEADDALEHLEQAIKLRPENRYHARNDADFKLLEDEPRFRGLVYPDQPAPSRVGALRV